MACSLVVPRPRGDALSDHQYAAEDEQQLQQEQLPLPRKFIDFLQRQNVDPRIYYVAQRLPRYIRLKPSAYSEVSEIEEELSCTLEPVPWIAGFYQIPASVQLSSTNAYKLGKIFGMDAASGAPIMAMDVNPGDHVLDLCAAPGAKMCMIAEKLGSRGTLTGVDISRSRLAACRTMLQKYELSGQSRLFLADGTTFTVLPLRTGLAVEHTKDYDPAVSYLIDKDSSSLKEWRPRRTRKEKKAEQRSIYLEKTKGRHTTELFFYGRDSGITGLSLSEVLHSSNANAAEYGYDKVLVDAECTHDGSLRHICKFEQWGWETFDKRFFDEERISSIADLQLKLLINGFQLLKRGGTLVYSTCSFTFDQNEAVVTRFLNLHGDAELREVDAAKSWPCSGSSLKHSLRFDPIVSNTNGQFLAKIVKI